MFQLWRNLTHLHVIFHDLKEVEEAPRLGKLIIIVHDLGVQLGQVVGIILPVDLDGLQIVVGNATKKIVIVYIYLSPAKNLFPTVAAIINLPCPILFIYCAGYKQWLPWYAARGFVLGKIS